jgi:hypothetical protein
MNKKDARRYAKRLIVGYIEELCYARKSDPLVYDDMCDDRAAEGRRLSEEDRDRVLGEVYAIYNTFSDHGWPSDMLRAFYKPDGKPGAKWKKYKDWLKRQGRT